MSFCPCGRRTAPCLKKGIKGLMANTKKDATKSARPTINTVRAGPDIPLVRLWPKETSRSVARLATDLVTLGIWLIDNANLEDLAEACAQRNRYEFMLSLGPLKLRNVTGSPVNPIAIF